MVDKMSVGIVTIVVKDIRKNEIVKIEHCDFFEAAMCRQSLENEYPYPDFDILEIVSESKAFIYADVKLSSDLKEKIDRRYVEEIAAAPEATEPMNRLKKAVDSKNLQSIEEIADDLIQKHPNDITVLKEVGVSYALIESKLDEAIKIFLTILERDPNNIEIYGLLGRTYAKASNWSEAAKYFEKETEFEKVPKLLLDKLGNAAFMYWKDGNYKKAEELAQKGLTEAERMGDRDAINSVRNSLSYYWAELGENLDQAKGWCLEILGVDTRSDYMEQIKSKVFERKDAKILDTLGRILESMGLLFDAFQVLNKANELEVGHPIVRDNLLRIYNKLGEHIKSR
jgi:tetratricopeptide (TPR) repeat protein